MKRKDHIMIAKANILRCLAFALAAVLLLGCAAPGAMAENEPVNLMVAPEDMYDVDVYDPSTLPFWGQKWTERGWVSRIEFHDTKEGAPKEVWDFSARHDKSVIGWYRNGVLTVAADGKITLNKNSSWLFAYFTHLRELDFGNAVDTSQVTNMKGMFFMCRQLRELDVSFFETTGVTSMQKMFGHCEKLTHIDVSSFDTSDVKDFGYMFFNDKNLEELDVTNFDTSKGEYFQSMFYNCRKLESLDVTGFNTSKAKTMVYILDECVNLKDIDTSGWDISSCYIQTRLPGRKK